MTITLQKLDGDLYLDPETGRPVTVTGATKVDQELADLYLTSYDTTRNWGASLDLQNLSGGASTIEQVRSLVFFRLQQANDRILAKQAQDPMLTAEETIQEFSQTDVLIDTSSQSIIFFSVADVGDTSVAKTIGLTFKATSLKQVIPPPPGIIPSY
jgi:hypothetical protein